MNCSRGIRNKHFHLNRAADSTVLSQLHSLPSFTHPQVPRHLTSSSITILHRDFKIISIANKLKPPPIAIRLPGPHQVPPQYPAWLQIARLRSVCCLRMTAGSYTYAVGTALHCMTLNWVLRSQTASIT
jgi:hypothetical protein